jgi:F-type H+-transporting ATPase subunit gamma
MPTLKEIGTRITAIKSVKMTTEAMKMIAQAKVTKAEQRLKETRLFAANIEQAFKAATEEEPIEAPDASHQCIVLGTDQGLCGSINSGLGRHIVKKFENDGDCDNKATLFAFGNRALNSVQSNLEQRMDGGIYGYQKSLTFRQCLMIADEFMKEVPSQRTFVFNRIINMAQFEIIEAKIPGRYALERSFAEEGEIEIEGANEVMDDFYDFHFAVNFWHLLSEVEASELSSRVMAMTNSTTAAGEMETELSLIYSKLRQEQITTEIIEISTGAVCTLKNNRKED